MPESLIAFVGCPQLTFLFSIHSERTPKILEVASVVHTHRVIRSRVTL
jgi:hypothetical protein